MSSKSAVKLVVPPDGDSLLFKWVSILTGSKNALKGAGFFRWRVLTFNRRIFQWLDDYGGGAFDHINFMRYFVNSGTR